MPKGFGPGVLESSLVPYIARVQFLKGSDLTLAIIPQAILKCGKLNVGKTTAGKSPQWHFNTGKHKPVTFHRQK